MPVIVTARFSLSSLVVRRARVAAAGLAFAAVLATASVASGQETTEIDLARGASVIDRADRSMPPLRRATIISDSAMAGIRWNGALGGLRGFDADDRLESCRRLVDTSCNGREDRRPNTALVEIGLLPRPAATEVLIIATGYNDRDAKFAAQSRQVLDAAVAKGYQTIVWVTYRENGDYLLPSDQNREVSNYAAMNNELDRLIGHGEYPQLQLWDLHDYTRFTSTWFSTKDGVHQQRRGSWGVADWISRKMALLDGRPCPMPWTRTFPQDQVCPDPNEVKLVRGFPDIDALYEL